MSGSPTYWNGEPTPCNRIRVRVPEGPSPFPRAWYRGLEGTVRNAVEVLYDEGRMRYLLDDDEWDGETPDLNVYRETGRIEMVPEHVEAGQGWYKVTHGGGPNLPHRQLPDDCEVLPGER